VAGASTEHRDEIWDVGEAHVPEGLDIAYMYASTFRVSFADMGEWNRLWSEVVAPILEQAMNEGLLGGWVRLEHNTGGPHNSKVLYMFDSWDDIDDLFGKLLGTMAEARRDVEAGRTSRNAISPRRRRPSAPGRRSWERRVSDSTMLSCRGQRIASVSL
jgi:hypothetical protein